VATNEERRERSENKLLNAFETVLMRDGLAKLKVNAIVKEAGVGKGLLYDYFTDLEGLAKAWAQWTKFNTRTEDITAESAEKFSSRKKSEQISLINKNYATMVKESPLALQLLRTEVSESEALNPILKRIKNKIGQAHENLFMSDPYFTQPEAMSVLMILHAASNYLALRAVSEPNFNGIQLDTEDGWQQMMSMIDQVSELLD